MSGSAQSLTKIGGPIVNQCKNYGNIYDCPKSKTKYFDKDGTYEPRGFVVQPCVVKVRRLEELDPLPPRHQSRVNGGRVWEYHLQDGPPLGGRHGL